MKMPRSHILIILLSLSVCFLASGLRAEAATDSLRSTSSSIAHLRLKGTLFTRNLKPLAVVEDTRDGQVVMYEEGDVIGDGFEIMHITRGNITLKAPQGEYNLSFSAGSVFQPQAEPEDENWYNIKREGDIIVVDAETIARAITRSKSIMANIKIKPYLANGQRAGIVITRLTPVGILKDIGLKQGDIVKSINDLKISTPHQIFRAYKNLKTEKELRIDIIRDNKPLILTYRIE